MIHDYASTEYRAVRPYWRETVKVWRVKTDRASQFRESLRPLTRFHKAVLHRRSDDRPILLRGRFLIYADKILEFLRVGFPEAINEHWLRSAGSLHRHIR